MIDIIGRRADGDQVDVGRDHLLGGPAASLG
jgi:hypothetical protein